MLAEETGVRTVPRVYINGVCIGGYSDTSRLYSGGKLQKMLDCCTTIKDFDADNYYQESRYGNYKQTKESQSQYSVYND